MMHENTVSVQINKIIFNNNLKHLFFNNSDKYFWKTKIFKN